MDVKEAIGILRSEIGPSSVLHREIAENMGAQALEAWTWVERTKATVEPMGGGWTAEMIDSGGRWWVGNGLNPLAAVLDAMEKEGNGGTNT